MNFKDKWVVVTGSGDRRRVEFESESDAIAYVKAYAARTGRTPSIIKDSAAKNFIDSVVGNIARKIEDEFNEADHPRDKGGKFTTKGGEGKGSNSEADIVKNAIEKVGYHEGDFMREIKKSAPKGMNEWERTKWESKMRKAFHSEYSNKKQEWKKNDPIPETETEKAAKEELASKNVDKLVSAAMEGFMDDHELGLDFLKAMRVRTKDLYDEEGELDEDAYADRIEKAIRNNPEKAADNLEQLGDILYEENEPEEENEASKETDDILEEFNSSGIDMVEAMEDLGLSAYDIPEGHVEEAFSEELYGSKALREEAKKYIKRYRGEDLVEDIQKELRRNTSTDVEDLIDYARDDGYDAELESEEYMIVRKNGKEYRAHIDKVGSTYYVDRVEEL